MAIQVMVINELGSGDASTWCHEFNKWMKDWSDIPQRKNRDGSDPFIVYRIDGGVWKKLSSVMDETYNSPYTGWRNLDAAWNAAANPRTGRRRITKH